MGETLHVFGDLRDALLSLAKLFTESWGRRRKTLAPSIQFDRQKREALIDVIMKLSADPGTFLFLGFNQPPPNGRKTLFCEFSFGEVYTRADVASEGAIRIESRYAFIKNPTILPIVSPQPILQLKLLLRSNASVYSWRQRLESSG